MSERVERKKYRTGSNLEDGGDGEREVSAYLEGTEKPKRKRGSKLLILTYYAFSGTGFNPDHSTYYRRVVLSSAHKSTQWMSAGEGLLYRDVNGSPIFLLSGGFDLLIAGFGSLGCDE